MRSYNDIRDTDPAPPERDTIPPPPPDIAEVLKVVVDLSSAFVDHETRAARESRMMLDELIRIRKLLAAVESRIDSIATNSEKILALEDWKRKHEARDERCGDCPQREAL